MRQPDDHDTEEHVAYMLEVDEDGLLKNPDDENLFWINGDWRRKDWKECETEAGTDWLALSEYLYPILLYLALFIWIALHKH